MSSIRGRADAGSCRCGLEASIRTQKGPGFVIPTMSRRHLSFARKTYSRCPSWNGWKRPWTHPHSLRGDALPPNRPSRPRTPPRSRPRRGRPRPRGGRHGAKPERRKCLPARREAVAEGFEARPAAEGVGLVPEEPPVDELGARHPARTQRVVELRLPAGDQVVHNGRAGSFEGGEVAELRVRAVGQPVEDDEQDRQRAGSYRQPGKPNPSPRGRASGRSRAAGSPPSRPVSAGSSPPGTRVRGRWPSAARAPRIPERPRRRPRAGTLRPSA